METRAFTLPNILQKVFFWTEYFQDEEDNAEIYGMDHLNGLVYEELRKQAEKFIGKYEYEIWKILEIEDITSYLAENEIYEIYANGKESCISFKDENIQNFFETMECQR